MSDEVVQDIDIGKSMSMLFGTPVISCQWPHSEELNQELTEVILANERSDDRAEVSAQMPAAGSRAAMPSNAARESCLRPSLLMRMNDSVWHIYCSDAL